MFEVDMAELAELGARARLVEIETECAYICGLFPDLCGGETPQRRERPEIAARPVKRLTEAQLTAMRQNVARAREARRRRQEEAAVERFRESLRAGQIEDEKQSLM